MRFQYGYLASLAVVTAVSAEPPQCDAKEGACSSTETAEVKPLQCNVYMAPSTLGKDTNMGIYTGKDLTKDEVVNFPEIAVPLFFREWGEGPEGYYDGTLWERYIWEGSVVDLESYDETDLEVSKAAFIPGVGCTVNAVMDMHNIDSTHGSTYDNAGLHRSKDPGVGAFAPYHSSVTNAAEDIPAGSELFAGYGTEWIPSIPGAQITLNPQLDKADDFLRDDYLPFIEAHKDELTNEMKQALWEFTSKDFPVYSQAMTNLPRFPWSEVEKFVEDNLESEEEVSITRHFIRKQSMRTLDWLNEYGYCQDHIRPATSKIPQAGRGAFANRDLPEGTVVGYAPLIHIGTDGREIYDIEYTNVGSPGTRHMYDLIINYSFGHKNSTMLLTPYGGMVNFINHGAGEKANVKVRFPDKELIAHKPDWISNDAEFFHFAVEKIGLSFEYVALRDIAEGEEVLMDYGPEWEAAWAEHVLNWEPLQDAEEYSHATEWQQPYFRTMEELEVTPYPDNLHTMCIESFTTNEDGDYVWVDVLRDTTERRYCDVMARRGSPEDGYVYDIDLKLDPEDDNSWVLVKDVNPDQGIFLYDKPFTTDWHQPNVFRHWIAVPDDVMPPAWQNGPDTHVLAEPTMEGAEDY